MKNYLVFLLPLFAISCTSFEMNNEYKGKDLQREKITFINAHQIREHAFLSRKVEKELTNDVSYFVGEFVKNNSYNYNFDHCYQLPIAVDLEDFFWQLENGFDDMKDIIPQRFHSLYNNCPSNYVLLIKHNGFYETTGRQVERFIGYVFVNLIVELFDNNDDEDPDDWDNDPDLYVAPAPPDIETDFSYVIIDRLNNKLVIYDRNVYQDDPTSEHMLRKHIRDMLEDMNSLRDY